MTHKELILDYLRRNDNRFCDDCLAQELAIHPRQTINQICRSLATQGAISRSRNRCDQCDREKIINRIAFREQESEERSTGQPEEPELVSTAWSAQDDWFWEGNVQKQIAVYLELRGWKIESLVDTASKEAGPDIVATKGKHNLKVSVKGWPSDKYVSGPKKGQVKPTRPYNQARHWFAEAIFELLMQAPTAGLRLALGFPDYDLYRKLWSRTRWALSQLRISCFFVGRDGSVEEAL